MKVDDLVIDIYLKYRRFEIPNEGIIIEMSDDFKRAKVKYFNRFAKGGNNVESWVSIDHLEPDLKKIRNIKLDELLNKGLV